MYYLEALTSSSLYYIYILYMYVYVCLCMAGLLRRWCIRRQCFHSTKTYIYTEREREREIYLSEGYQRVIRGLSGLIGCRNYIPPVASWALTLPIIAFILVITSGFKLSDPSLLLSLLWIISDPSPPVVGFGFVFFSSPSTL